MIKLVIGVTLGVVALALLVGSNSSSDESSAGVGGSSVGDPYAYSSAGDPYTAGRQVAQEAPPLPVETTNSVVADVLNMNTTPAPTVAVLKPIDVEPSDEVIKTVDKQGGTVLTVSFPDPGVVERMLGRPGRVESRSECTKIQTRVMQRRGTPVSGEQLNFSLRVVCFVATVTRLT